MKRALVTGAGGFIGAHLVRYLKARGYWVRGVDVKRPEFAPTEADEFMLADLRIADRAYGVMYGGFDEVYALAADMGGMGYINSYPADILYNNVLINTHTLDAARHIGAERYFFASSACVYPEGLQTSAVVSGLKEADAYPAAPDTEYGWEKLFSERMAMSYAEAHGMTVRIARFHNIYGPMGTWRGGREKAPAALCRKVAESVASGNRVIEVWGDGEQTRSFCYIADCLEGIYRLMHSDFSRPLNIGSSRLISINDLAEMIAQIAGVQVTLRHIEGPQGVRGRNSDNTLCREVLKWEPSTSLEDGLTETYRWIEAQVLRVAA